MPEESLIGMTLSAIGGLGCVGCATGTILVILHAAKDGRSWECVNVTNNFGPSNIELAKGRQARVLLQATNHGRLPPDKASGTPERGNNFTGVDFVPTQQSAVWP
jgi:hypothetical protein